MEVLRWEKMLVHLNLFNCDLKIKYYIDDLVDENTKVLMILESPSYKELICDFPLAGRSGSIISKVLFENQKSSLGELKNQKSYLTKNIGVMNVAQIPMQFNDYCKTDLSKKSLEILKKLDWLRTRISQENKLNINFQKEYSQKQNIIYTLGYSFSLRLFQYILAAKIKHIYLCGVIAQNFYTKFCSHSVSPFVNQIVKISHPARRKDNEWKTQNHKIIELKKKI